MFCFLPGGGGAKAAEALERLALSLVGGIALITVTGLFGFALFSKWRRSKAAEFTKLTDFSVSVQRSNHFKVETNVSDAATKPIRSSARTMEPNLIDQIRNIDWFQFEKLVGLTYRKLGYSVEQRGGANPDGGIDLIVQKDGERISVQCKHWQNWDVKVTTVREFLGALADAGIKKGIFVTLNGYTGEAKQLAERHSIDIINETKLVEMLEATNARFDPETSELMSDSRKFCPKCDSELVIRKTKRGLNAGREFWGCSNFPNCRFQMPLRA